MLMSKIYDSGSLALDWVHVKGNVWNEPYLTAEVAGSILGAGPILRVAPNQGMQPGIALAPQTARLRGANDHVKWRFRVQ